MDGPVLAICLPFVNVNVIGIPLFGTVSWTLLSLLSKTTPFRSCDVALSTQTLPLLLRHIPKPILRPSKAPLMKCPRLHTLILPRRTRCHIDGHQMIHPWVRLSGVPPFNHLPHPIQPALRIALHRLLQRIIEADGIGKRPGIAPSKLHVPQVMHRHAGTDNHHALIAELLDRLPQTIVRVRIFRLEQRDLHQGNGDGLVGVGWESDVEAREDAVVKPALETLGLDGCLGKELLDLGGYLGGSGSRESRFVEVVGETVEIVDEVCRAIAVVEVDLGGGGLPVRGENDDGLGLDFLNDFLADGLEDGVDGVFGVVLDVGLGEGVSR